MGCRSYSEPYPVSCLIDTETPTREKKLTTRWVDCRLEPWYKLPQFQELTTEKWEQTNPRTEDELYLKQSTEAGQSTT